MANLSFTTSFHPVIDLPKNCPVLELSTQEGQQAALASKSLFNIGRYLEVRPNMYLGDNYENENRNIHMGVDIGAPAGTDIFNFYQGRVFGLMNNDGHLDYGPTLVTEHEIEQRTYWVLWGHLSTEVLQQWKVGDEIKSGEVIAQVGSSEVNGGWPPHLHFQVSTEKPENTDFPGVVSEKDLEKAQRLFPDPRCFLGNIY